VFFVKVFLCVIDAFEPPFQGLRIIARSPVTGAKAKQEIGESLPVATIKVSRSAVTHDFRRVVRDVRKSSAHCGFSVIFLYVFRNIAVYHIEAYA
jgi:hypothetical protein